VYALKRTHMRILFLLCVKVSQFESFLCYANLAAMFCTRSSAFICPFLWGSQHALLKNRTHEWCVD
jgi:hypothetical protein